MGTPPLEAREVSGFLLRAVLRYVERAAGADAVRAIAERSGIDDAEAVMRYTGRWYSIAQTLRVANEAARVCGDSAIGRRAGEEHVLEACEQRGFREFVVALGTVPAAMELVLQRAQRMSGGRRFTVVEESDGRLLVGSQAVTASGYPTFFCECVQGILASVPPILGYSARVVERWCQARGDDRCQYELTWGPDPRHVPRDLDLAVSASVVEARLSTAEEIHNMAAELLRFHDIDKLLSQICDAATASIEAPRFLLALRVGGSQTLRVHQRGFADDAVARTRALELERGRGRTAGDGVLLANFAERGVEGFLAALSIAGAGYSSAEVRALDAYAGHAQAALNIVAVLERAQCDRDTARVLLALAGKLAGATNVGEVADHLTTSAPLVAECDTATMWCLEPDRRELRMEAFVDVSTLAWAGPMVRTATEHPGLFDCFDADQPYVWRADASAGEFDDFLRVHGINFAISFPIAARGALLGVLEVGFRHLPDDDRQAGILHALGGLAGHAANALENVRLLEDIRHRAMHDTLTGLPNRPLIEDRTDRCLRSAATTGDLNALLFVDLDRFKIVNDTYGHAAGDELICQVAARLESMMRGSDTVARFGGDEFVILLTCTDAKRAADVGRRISRALEAPFLLSGHEVFVSCSVGVACAPEDGTDYVSLVRHADAEMYRAKSRGRDAVERRAPVTGGGHDGCEVARDLV